MSSAWPDIPNVGKTTRYEVLPAEPTPVPAKYIRLGTVRQIRTELAAVYRGVRTGLIPSSEGTRLTYMLTQLANMTVDSEIADRVEKLEKERG